MLANAETFALSSAAKRVERPTWRKRRWSLFLVIRACYANMFKTVAAAGPVDPARDSHPLIKTGYSLLEIRTPTPITF